MNASEIVFVMSNLRFKRAKNVSSKASPKQILVCSDLSLQGLSTEIQTKVLDRSSLLDKIGQDKIHTHARMDKSKNATQPWDSQSPKSEPVVNSCQDNGYPYSASEIARKSFPLSHAKCSHNQDDSEHCGTQNYLGHPVWTELKKALKKTCILRDNLIGKRLQLKEKRTGKVMSV